MTKEGIVTEENVQQIKDRVQAELQRVYDSMKEDSMSGISELKMPEVLANNIDHYETAVPLEELEKLNEDLLKYGRF